ncbi:hypothetical protein VC83_01997 [Pseudogymnoascus destructans]|uniref:Uncharacterized protein n=2 Tax=Pseudogymnoascus destructans TaxID=655981 RepID=L8FXQ2_PSED2|nr:uncharacterized protein VC83_01997 [Pseudogymnoascus destructans]ELR04481.1 hypothetical protein GMDG_06787 [Pseudogymnoascus destructans 20631-21]OAF61418.1 hypothetical protein VC83_01997 [Pseudogymnoascus destructans]
MSINNGSHFVADDNNLSNIFDDQLHMSYQGAMNHASLGNQYGNQTGLSGAMNGISLPENAYEGQASEARHVSFGQGGGLGFNPYMRQQIAEEPLQSYTPTPAPMVDNNPLQHSYPTAYSQNQIFQPRQNGMNRGLRSLPSPSEMGMRSRTGRGVLPPRLSEPSMGFGFNNFSTGSGDMASYNPQVPTPMHAFGNGYSGTTNTAQARDMRSGFRRSLLNIIEPRYDNQNGFAQHLDMQSNNSANMAPNMGHPGSVFQPQPEAEGWTRDQINKQGDALSSENAQRQSPVLADHEADAPDGSDTSEDSDGTVCSPSDQDLPSGQELSTVQGSAASQESSIVQDSTTVEGSTTAQSTEDVAGDDRTSHSGMRGSHGEPMSSRQFKGHFDRAAHRAGSYQQKVGKPLGRRSKGANDPENIAIVNWYDNYNMSFVDIAQRLNSRQEATGKPGTFTPNSIHNRYNRCAPIIYRANGRVFIAIKDRRKHAPEELDAMSYGLQSIEWTPNKDRFLRNMVQEYDANKWLRVAEAFTALTGERVSSGAVSTRFSLI